MADKRLTAPPPGEAVLEGNRFSRVWWRWVSRVTAVLQGNEPLQIASYTVATLPAAADWPRCIVIVTDEGGGETLAASDGSVWRRVTDLTEVTV